MKTLIFNGLRFLPLPPTKTVGDVDAHGYFTANAKGVHLYRLDLSLEAFLVRNPLQGYFVVTATLGASGTRYMFSMCEATEAWLGLQDLPLTAEEQLVRDAVVQDLDTPSPRLA